MTSVTPAMNNAVHGAVETIARIESALVAHPLVTEAGVCPISDPLTGHAIAAFVVLATAPVYASLVTIAPAGVLRPIVALGYLLPYLAYTWVLFEYGALSPTLLMVMFAVRCLSGALLGGLLGHLATEALYRTGVLSGLAIDHERRTARV